MSSSSDEAANDVEVKTINASYFRRKCFWTWVEGVDFATLPITQTKIRCILERESPEEKPCKECVAVWARSGLRESLQSVPWGAEVLESQVCFGIVRMFQSTC